MDKNKDFPQFRKLSNNKAFYKILSLDEFEEVQIIGSKSRLHRVKATKYPEKLRIMDMLSDETLFLKCSEKEYDQIKHQ
jgi:hypothetical protein